MSDPKWETVSRTETGYTLKIGRKLLVEMLRDRGYIFPPNAELVMEVPRGGDWSGMEIDVSDEHPVIVRFTAVAEKSS